MTDKMETGTRDILATKHAPTDAELDKPIAKCDGSCGVRGAHWHMANGSVVRFASRSQQRRHAAQTGEPAPFFDDRGVCDGCGKTKDRVIRRIGTSYGSQKVCDECFNANPT